MNTSSNKQLKLNKINNINKSSVTSKLPVICSKDKVNSDKVKLNQKSLRAKSLRNLKGGKMTDHQVSMQQVHENKRHNMEQEKIGRQANKMGFAGRVIGSGIQAIGKLGSVGLNHPSWYTRDPSLSLNSGNLSFNKPAGLQFNKIYPYHIAVHHYANSIGVDYDVEPRGTGVVFWNRWKDSSIDTAARQIYAYVRHANSGARNYEAVDMMMYILAVVDVYARIVWLMRVARIVATYIGRNRLMGDKLLEALWIQPLQARNLYPTLVYNINLAIKRVTAFAIPKDMSILDRKAWLNANVFKDYDTEKCSYHLFNPIQCFRYSDAEAALISETFPDYVAGSQRVDLTATMNTLFGDINELMDLSDVGIMSGDILKAYGTDGIYKMDDFVSGERIEPVHDEDILMQISNARYFPSEGVSKNQQWSVRQLGSDKTATGHLYQATDNLTFDTEVDPTSLVPCLGMTISKSNVSGTPAACIANEWILDEWSDNPTTDEVLVGSRFICSVENVLSYSDTSDYHVYSFLHNAGTEVLTASDIYEVSTDYGINILISGIITSIESDSYYNLIRLATISHFHSFPRVICAKYGVTYKSIDEWMNYWYNTIPNAVNDVADLILIGDEEINRLNNTCTMSEFYVPSIGKVSSYKNNG